MSGTGNRTLDDPQRRPDWELDHFFICTAIDAPEAAHLIEFGFREGPANVHPGQGTACRRFFFHNAMLELLWVNDGLEAKSELTRPTKLWERWSERESNACPFGICFRPTSDNASPPIPTWAYRPIFLPESMHIDMATNTERFSEPMMFFSPLGMKRTKSPLKSEQMDHPCALRKITRLEMTNPIGEGFSTELQTAINLGLLKLRAENGYLMEIGFDNEIQGQRMDFRPDLPLVIFW